MELFDLTGQVAIVTGSTHGIGRAIAERMAQHGARVVISSRTPADCDARVAEINEKYAEERAIGVPCDLSDVDQIRNLVETTLKKWGRIDSAVGNAAVTGSTTAWIEKIDDEEFALELVGNIRNNLVFAKLVVPTMREQGGGTIIFNSSSSGVASLEDYPAYGTANAWLRHLASILAVQLGPLNIRVNAVAPGIIAQRGMVGPWARPDLVKLAVGDTPLQRLGKPDEIAACVVFLASPGGAFATGQTFVVDGGQTLKGMHGPHAVRVALREEAERARGA